MLRQVVLVFGLLTLAVSQSEAHTAMVQVAGSLNSAKTYWANTEITDFVRDGPCVLFTISGGKLVVQSAGNYYIYGQAYFEEGPGSNHRVGITVNGQTISLLAAPSDPDSATYGNRFTGVLKHLQQGDRIGFKSVLRSKMFMASQHTFFGAYKIE